MDIKSLDRQMSYLANVKANIRCIGNRNFTYLTNKYLSLTSLTCVIP